MKREISDWRPEWLNKPFFAWADKNGIFVLIQGHTVGEIYRQLPERLWKKTEIHIQPSGMQLLSSDFKKE